MSIANGNPNRASFVLFVLALLLVWGCWNNTSILDLKAPESRAAYPETDEGFRKFVSDLVNAHEGRGSVQSRMHSSLIPNSSSWFIEVFGPTNGPVLDFQYRYQLGWQFSRLYAYLPVYAKNHTGVIFAKSSERGNVSPFVAGSSLISAAARPLKIYSASISQEEGPSLKIGSFVYVAGNFRFLGYLDMHPDWESFYREFGRPFED